MSPAADFAVKTRRGLLDLGLRLASDAEIALGQEIAVRTVGPAVATVETLTRVQRRTGAACFVHEGADGRLAAVLALIPLSPAAAPGLAAGVFDGLTPADELIAGPGDPVIALYGWGMAGITWRGRAVVTAAAVKLHREIHPALPLYGRAATPGGARALLGRIGARPVPGPGGLVVAQAWTPQRRVA